MAREIVLHIGISKTGTSSIQRCLDRARPQLAERGILVPVTPGKANHGLLAFSFGPPHAWKAVDPRVWAGVDPARRLALFRTAFAEEMASIPDGIERVVMSAEQLAHQVTTPEAITALRDFLAPFADRFRIIVYLRRQDSHFASAQVQLLRTASLLPPKLPTQTSGLFRLGLAHVYDYAALLGRWERVFGAEAIVPRIFERSCLVDGDAVDDFFALIDAPGLVPKDAPERLSNQSITLEGIALLLAMGKYLQGERSPLLSPQSTAWKRFVERVSQAMPGRGWKPPAADARAFLRLFEAANEAVRARWFPERPSLFSEVEEAPGDEPPPPADGTTLAACRLLMEEIVRNLRAEADRACQAARAAEREGQAQKAEQQFRAALRADPDCLAAHAGLCRLLAREGKVEAAGLHLDAVRRIDPGFAGIEMLERMIGRAKREGTLAQEDAPG